MASPALDLSRNITPPTHGPRAGLVVGECRELSHAPAAPPSGPSVLVQLRHSHHKLAMCLAEGMRVFEASAATGYAPGTVSALQADPTFSALVTHYKEVRATAFIGTAERMSALSSDAIEVLQERITNDPDQVSTDMLVKLATAMLDRTGHAPVVKAHVVHSKFDPAEMNRLREQAATGVTLVAARGVGVVEDGAALPPEAAVTLELQGPAPLLARVNGTL